MHKPTCQNYSLLLTRKLWSGWKTSFNNSNLSVCKLPTSTVHGGDSIPAEICPLDTIMTRQPTQLLKLFHTLGLYIVNGRLRVDSYSRYTYSSSIGSSTVDDFITDLNTDSLRAITVSPLTPLSDHSKITVYLNRAKLNHEASKPKELNNIKKCYEWKGTSMETYQKQLGNNKFNPF